MRIAALVGTLVVVLSARAFADPDPPPATGSDAPTLDTPTPDQPVAVPVPVKDPALAKRWLGAAQQLVQKGDYFASHGKPDDAKVQYGNAVIAYTKAIESGDDVTVNLALALVEDKLGNQVDAYKHLTLVATAQGVNPDVAKKAQAKLDEVAGKVGTVKLTVTPDGAEISIGGSAIGETPLPAPLVLAPGTYALTFTATGYQPKDAELKIEAGSESERKIDLDPVPIVVPPHVDEPPPDATAPHAPPSLVPIIVGGSVTLALVTTATITGVAAITQHHAFTDPTYSPSERKTAQSTGRLEEHITDLCWGGAIAAAAFTGYWYWFRVRKPHDASVAEPARVGPKVDIIPWVQPDASGVVARGSF